MCNLRATGKKLPDVSRRQHEVLLPSPELHPRRVPAPDARCGGQRGASPGPVRGLVPIVTARHLAVSAGQGCPVGVGERPEWEQNGRGGNPRRMHKRGEKNALVLWKLIA